MPQMLPVLWLLVFMVALFVFYISMISISFGVHPCFLSFKKKAFKLDSWLYWFVDYFRLLTLGS